MKPCNMVELKKDLARLDNINKELASMEKITKAKTAELFKPEFMADLERTLKAEIASIFATL